MALGGDRHSETYFDLEKILRDAFVSFPDLRDELPECCGTLLPSGSLELTGLKPPHRPRVIEHVNVDYDGLHARSGGQLAYRPRYVQ